MIQFLLLITLSNVLLFAGPREEASDILLRFQSETSISKRMDLISKTFVGLPYGFGGPLGEGKDGRYDQDPLYRFDTFDCTTYVETVMALALSGDVDEFERHQDEIRYEYGEVDYLKRNHFTDLQWIPFNIRNGYMQEITHEMVSPAELKLAEALINFPGWLKSLKINEIVVPMATTLERQSLVEELHALAPNYYPQIAQVPYIEINRILAQPEILAKIPSGTVVNIVRPNWDLTEAAGTHQNISHQGFLFKMKGVLHLRHATSAGAKVQEIPFIDYLKQFQNHPTLKGIHLMKVN